MNKRGSAGIAVVVALMLLIIGMLVVNFLMPEVTRARAATDGLDCANASGISDGNKLTCLAVDLVIPYFIVIVFAASGGFITKRLLI